MGGGVAKTKCTRNNQSLNITGMTLHLAPSLVHVGGVKAAKGCEAQANVTSRLGKVAEEAEGAEEPVPDV